MDKRPIAIICLMFLASCGPRYTVSNVQAQSNPTDEPLATPSLTLVPSVTVDYQQTAVVAEAVAHDAQATANEARRINAIATAEYVRLMNEQIAFTAEVERQDYAVMSWTATAAGTSIPLTATQQAAINTQVPAQQTLESEQLHATQYAPTHAIAMARAEVAVTWGERLAFGEMVWKIGMGALFMFLAVYLFAKVFIPERKVSVPVEPEPVRETVVHIRAEKTGGDFSQTRYVIPCTPEQLTEFAEAITQGRKTMAINQWEGVGTLFTRPVILQLRSWARSNGFATPTEDNQLAPTNDFLDFLCRWLDNQKLPTEYEFMPESPSPTAKNGHESHEYESFDRVSA